MDAKLNPYVVVAGGQPLVLAGRGREIARFRSSLNGRSERCVVVTGLHGVGKTAVLGEFGKLASEAGWVVASGEASAGGVFGAQMAILARRAILALGLQRPASARAGGVVSSLLATHDRDDLAAHATGEPMAKLGPGPHKASDVAAVLGKTSAKVAMHRHRLIKKDLLYAQSHGYAAFTVPHFDRYLNRQTP